MIVGTPPKKKGKKKNKNKPKNSCFSLRYILSTNGKCYCINFNFLMFLNQCSGISFNDLTRYPRFPWIITDYTSNTIDINVGTIYRDLFK